MKSIKEIIEKMTVEEKIALINGASFFGTAEFSELGIRRLQFLDGGTGINFEQLFGDFCSQDEPDKDSEAVSGNQTLIKVIENFYKPDELNEEETKLYEKIKEKLDAKTGMPDMSPGCFPPGIMLGATFNPETVHQVGEALGAEATVYGIDVLLGTPNINIHRDPLGGRLFEGYSEDPYLISVLAPELVKGVQEYPVAANVKHFAVNNQETNRVGLNVTIGARALEEIYLPGFKACVEEGKVKTVMSAYNKINGVPCTENKWLLKEKLREQWGFDGMVISDWGAVKNLPASVVAGNDLNMPGPVNTETLLSAVRNDEIKPEELDEPVENILQIIQYLDDKQKDFTPKFSTATELKQFTDEIAYKAAAEGIVLLKNENDVFPIKDNTDIIITGTGSRSILTCGTGSAGIVTDRNTSLSDELKKALGDNRVKLHPNISGHIKGQGETILVVATLPGMEGNDRKDMKLDKRDRAVLRELIIQKQKNANFRLGLILNVCGPVSLSEFLPYADGIFCIFLPGMQGGKALADILTGKINPSGKLPLTFPLHYADSPTCINFPGDGHEVIYGERMHVGYRYYDKKKIKPAYAFGYGLSYTSFDIFDISVSSLRFCDSLEISGKIKNTGDMAGAQVVQIYISDIYSTCPKPLKELRRFEKIFLEPGEEKTFSFTLREEDFSYYDVEYNTFVCEEGYYDIIVGVSSAAEDYASIKRVYKEGTSPYSYGLNTTCKVYYENFELKELLQKFWLQEGLDMGYLENTYQYTPGKKLYEILPQFADDDNEANKRLAKFLNDVSCVEKL
ncbi:MAG: hypothetical protein E7505_10020 [Ruminococcus sp.]|nr:hypothetical protein [Ruminococcus sp.]